MIAADSTHDIPVPSSSNRMSVMKWDVRINVNEQTNLRKRNNVKVKSLDNRHKITEVWSTNSWIDLNSRTLIQTALIATWSFLLSGAADDMICDSAEVKNPIMTRVESLAIIDPPRLEFAKPNCWRVVLICSFSSAMHFSLWFDILMYGENSCCCVFLRKIIFLSYFHSVYLL